MEGRRYSLTLKEERPKPGGGSGGTSGKPYIIYIGTERIKVYGSQTICRNVTVILQELQIYCKQKIDLI